MRDARPCRHAMATRGGDKQQPGAPPLSFPRGARCSFPLPLGGEGRVRGDRWRHLEPLGAPPLFLRLRLRGASPLSLILSPVGGEESGKGRGRLSRQAKSGLARPLIKAIRAGARMALPFPCAVPPLLSSSRAMRVLLSLSPWGERGG